MTFPPPLSGRDKLSAWLNQLRAAAMASRLKPGGVGWKRKSMGPDGTDISVEPAGAKKKSTGTLESDIGGDIYDLCLDGQGNIYIAADGKLNLNDATGYRTNGAVLNPDLSLKEYDFLADAQGEAIDCKPSGTIGSNTIYLAGLFTHVNHYARSAFNGLLESGEHILRTNDIPDALGFNVRYNSVNDRVYIDGPNATPLIRYKANAASVDFEISPTGWDASSGFINARGMIVARYTVYAGFLYVVTSGVTISGKDVGIDRLDVISVNAAHDAGFDPFWSADPGTRACAEYPDSGKIVVVGDVAGSGWSTIGSTNSGIAKMEISGAEDTTFDPGDGFSSTGPICCALDSHGNILAGGDFTTYQGVAAKNLVRINADGQRDTSFPDLNITGGIVRKILVEPAETILIGGSFTTVAGKTRRGICRLDGRGNVLGP